MGRRIRSCAAFGVLVLACLVLAGTPSTAVRAQDAAKLQASAYATKTPVLGAACSRCPWGAIADVVKEMMAPYGYNVAVCHNCYMADSTRIVSERRTAPKLTHLDAEFGTTTTPAGTIDFGVSSVGLVTDTYNGLNVYKADGPRKNLRVIAHIQQPSYLTVAVKKGSGITDLKQIKDKKLKVRILAAPGTIDQRVLAYYGISKTELESWGGTMGSAMEYGDLTFDVIVSSLGVLSNFPEGNIWYEASQKYDLAFLALPEDLLDTLANSFPIVRTTMPAHYFRGVDRPIPTVSTVGHFVYGRDDMPDQFAYDVAKAIDAHREKLRWTLLPFSYDTRTAWKSYGVPLHPGAERYYREAGYMK
jgi:TRAP transporter TAXI family solute receptor